MSVFRYNGIAEQGGHVLTTVGNVTTEKSVITYPACTVTVYNQGTTNLATIYSDTAATPKANPFTSSATDASYSFYASAGRYDLLFSGTGIITPFSVGDVTIVVDPASDLAQAVTPQMFGAIADGSSHPLSTRFGSLAAAQAAYNGAYSFITSLSQEIDYAAIKAASNFCFGADASEHAFTNSKLNRPLYIPSGTYEIGTDIWLIRNAVGIHIYGNERLSSVIHGSGTSVFATDGLWYSSIENLSFIRASSALGVVMEIDGNVPGHPYITRSVQQNTFTNIQASGASGTAVNTVGIRQNGLGGSSAQGENLWINPVISGVYYAFYNNGFNALGNQIVRGDMQDFVIGLYSVAGWANIDSTTFESGHPYEQATLGGFDINVGLAGVGETMVIKGVRTESLQFFKGSASQPAVLIGCEQVIGGLVGWTAFGAQQLHAVIVKPVTTGSITTQHAYYVSTAGSSGGAEPVWPATGTIADGSVVWTEMPYKLIDTTTISGVQVENTLSLFGNNFVASYGNLSIGGWSFSDMITRNQTATEAHSLGLYQWPRWTKLVDATAGNITLTLNAAPINQVLILKRVDSTANTVTIAGGTANIDGLSSVTLSQGEAVTLLYSANTVWTIIDGTALPEFGAPVTAAAAIVPSGKTFHVTGNTNITSITATGCVKGTKLTLIFDGTPTFTDGSNLKLAGNLVATADDTITLVYDGTNFYEIGRAVN